MAGLLVELVGGAGLLDPAFVHHHQLAGDVHRLFLVVGDEDRRHVHLLVEAAQPGAQVLAHLGVERPERLVEQQHLRLHRQRPRQRHPLPLAAGELGGVAAGEPVELDQLAAARGRAAEVFCLSHLRIFSPKATLSYTVMCLKAA